jgi:DNA-directed RNA polymerase subunit M/transcription elongation factor TFIIS
MIHIQCKKCGYRFPFSTKKYGYTAKNILSGNTFCPNCGKILIKDK